MASQNFVPVTGTIRNITLQPGSCCLQLVTLLTSGGIVTFTLSRDTYIAGSIQLRRGMHVTIFYDGSRPAPLIFPPRYQADVVAVLSRNETAVLKYFDEELLASDDSLKLNPGPATTILTANGQRYSCSPGGHLLLVYYHVTTRSIPPQTTPHRIIVFC